MAQDPTNSSSAPFRGGGSTLLHRSCHECNRRKVRCNKIHPCDHCVRFGVVCAFPPPGRKPRNLPKRTSNKAELVSRLNRLEGEFQKLGQSQLEVTSADLLEEQACHQSGESNRPVHSGLAKDLVTDTDGRKLSSHGKLGSPEATSSTLEDQFGRLVVDRNNGTSRYVNHRVLTDLANQIKEVRDLFEEPSSPALSDEDALSLDSAEANSETESPFLLGYHSLAYSLRSYHPPPAISHLLLGVFEENVAPIIRIIHSPALRDLIQTATTNPDTIDKDSEALVFSVYFAAISSMTAEQCLGQLGEDHATSVKRYRFAVEQALARAGFLHTRKLIVLQAAVLFLSCCSSPKDAHFVWTMIAVVARLGLGLGLHRDSSHFGLGPLETEMRRRLWWYIYLLDVRSSDSQATSPQIREGDYNTRLPLNINDNDLSPDSAETPKERIGFTDMTLTLVRCEILISHRNAMQMSSSGVDGHNTLFENRLAAVEQCRQDLEDRYLRFCDLSIPIHWVTATIARIALARLWLVSHFVLVTAEGFDPLSYPEQCDLLILTAIEVLEFVNLLETHENTAHWSWLFQGYVQWQSFAFVLSEICVRPASPFSDRAWLAASRVYERWNGPMGNRLGLMMRPLERLMHRAAAARRENVDRQPVISIENDSIDTFMPMANYMEHFPQNSTADEDTTLGIFTGVVNTLGI